MDFSKKDNPKNLTLNPEREVQGLLSFLSKIEVLSRTSFEVRQDILILSRTYVCSLMGVESYGCAVLWM